MTVKNEDVPPMLALCGLIIVLGLLFGLQNQEYLTKNYDTIVALLQRSNKFLSALSVSLVFNMMVISFIIKSKLAYKRQGSRLKSITKQETDWRNTLLKMAISFPLSFLAIIPMIDLLIIESKPLSNLLFREHYLVLVDVSTYSLWFSIFSMLYIVSKLVLILALKLKSLDYLPRIPNLKNHLILGTIGEEKEKLESSKKMKWVAVNQKALNGNVLITGSIGTGKTQGTILTYVDQLFEKFSPNPTALVLDPKGSFISAAKNILTDKGLEDKTLKLGEPEDTERFNPVWQDGLLKDLKYIEVTEMIRAASKNCSGSSSNDSSIWEEAAFNLTKNIIVFCAATKGYFTLTDCYQTSLIAHKDTIKTQLKKALKDDKFDVEEKFNIECAITYFKEFSEFESRIKTSILLTTTTFLIQFLDYRAAEVFCPKEEEITIKSMDELVDSGKILLFNVKNESLSRSMGTFVKLHFQKSVLDRLKYPSRGKDQLAIIVADEYQDIVSVGSNGSLGDDKVCAKGREANFMFLAASQSLSSIYASLGDDTAAKTLIQNFRTRIALQSTDIETIRNFKELIGQEDLEKKSHSVSENSQKTTKNFIVGGFDSEAASISESINTSYYKEHLITGREFSTLKSFEAFCQVYDGINTKFYKMYLKPHFLKKKNTRHEKILTLMSEKGSLLSMEGIKDRYQKLGTTLAMIFIMLFIPNLAKSFPTVCSVINSKEFNSCLGFTYSMSMCGYPPRPCVTFKYYVPQTYIEVSPFAGESFFSTLPYASSQLAGVSNQLPFGAEHDKDTQSYHARTIAIPYTNIPFEMMPCGGTRTTKFCFDGMSEHIKNHWSTGHADKSQPNFLAWMAKPKACHLKGAAMSVSGEVDAHYSSGSMMCSSPMFDLGAFPPSNHSACTGWGQFYPRMGSYNGPSQTAGALMIASRMKSLSSEVFQSTPSTFGEKWQMISPNTSSCFREGQNIGFLEGMGVTEYGRLRGRLKGHLFAIWKPVSCTKDVYYLATAKAAMAAMKPACAAIRD